MDKKEGHHRGDRAGSANAQISPPSLQIWPYDVLSHSFVLRGITGSKSKFPSLSRNVPISTHEARWQPNSGAGGFPRIPELQTDTRLSVPQRSTFNPKSVSYHPTYLNCDGKVWLTTGNENVGRSAHDRGSTRVLFGTCRASSVRLGGWARPSEFRTQPTDPAAIVTRSEQDHAALLERCMRVALG